MEQILAVDTNHAIHQEQTEEWRKYGIGAQRVNTINEAIHKLAGGEEFLFVVINEDTIPDFMNQLPVMRDVTGLPIFVVTSAYTVEKKIKAFSLGADVYDPFTSYTNARQAVLLMLETLKARRRWAEQPSKRMSILTSRDIVLSKLRRKVFVKDIEVDMPKKEFEILCCLIENAGCVMEHRQLMEAIWGEDYVEKDTDILWKAVNRVRTKLSKINPGQEYIRIERGVGYVFELE